MNDTMTVTNPEMFSVGQTIQIGNWPIWMCKLRIPIRARHLIYAICKWFGVHVSRPQVFRINAVQNQEIVVVGGIGSKD